MPTGSVGPLDSLKAEIEIERALLDAEYKRNGWLWALEQVNTLDEATQQSRPWPDEPYLKEVWDILQSEEQKIVFPKSRRMMISWILALWVTWTCRYYPNHLALIQSETEEKAAYITDKRCAYIEHHLEEPWNRRPFTSYKTLKGRIGKIAYHDTESEIYAVAQGASVVRAYTFSILVMDESEFQAEGEDALTAALPIVEESKSVKLVLISTSNGPDRVIAGICKEAGFVRFS